MILNGISATNTIAQAGAWSTPLLTEFWPLGMILVGILLTGFIITAFIVFALRYNKH